MKLVDSGRVILFVAAMIFSISASSQSFDEAIGSLAEKLGVQLGTEGTKRLAIYGFSDLNGFDSALGDFISEELTTSLFGAGDFDIVERNQLAQVLREHDRYAKDIFNSETITDLGEFLGIQALITGSVTQFDDSIRINARAIDVATTRVFAAASISVARDGMVNSLINQRSRSESTTLASVPGSISQSSSVFYQNSVFRVEPSSIRVLENGNGVTITMEVTNITSGELFLAGPNHNEPYATTKQGDTFEVSVEGLNTRPSNSGSFRWVAMQSGATITAVYKITTSENKEIIGNVLSLRSGLRVWKNGKNEEMMFNLDQIAIK